MVFYYILETVKANFKSMRKNENISTVAQQKDVVYHKQPFLIVVGTIQHPITYFLVVDQTAIPVSFYCYTAFNCLFASFFVFGLEYPSYLEKFFYFFEQYVYGIFPNKDKINASNQDFVNTLDDIALKVPRSPSNE